jgi:hypothetical protein
MNCTSQLIMRADSPRQVEGRISIVQEERFCLLSDGGRGLLFTLAHNADIGGPRLQRLRAANAKVCVGYSGEPGLASAVAHSVRALDSP